MSNEILSVLEYMEKEKGIPRDEMIAVIVDAIQTAAQKGVNAGQELKIEINPKTGALKAWALYQVVDSESDTLNEIHVEKARKKDPSMNVGDVFEKELDPENLGRIAAQAARQGIMQRVRQFEKERIYDDFKESVGDIITGTVRRRERGDLVVDLGKAEALLKFRERIAGEDYDPGERIRCLVLSIESTPRGPEIVLSRSSIDFVRRLIELEVNEVADGTVEIKNMAREAGYRTKIAVHAKDPKVDPVGACVGARGARVKSIVRELAGEKVDIIHHYDDPIKMLEEAVKPAVPKNIQINEKDHCIYFEVSEDDMSSVIGKGGKNARLTSRILGWRLNIGKEQKEAVGFEERMQRAVEGLNQIEGISDEIAQRLVAIGITSPEAFEGVTAADLADAGFTEEEAADTVSKVEAFHAAKS